MADFAHTCADHPDREGVQYCAKFNKYLCVDCIRCREPNHYCKFRTMCPIHEFEKHPEENIHLEQQKKAE